MKAIDKLRMRWFRSESDMGGFYPLGSQTKSDLGYLLHAMKPIIAELESRGYDKTTLRFSIEPQSGDTRFASQRANPEEPTPS